MKKVLLLTLAVILLCVLCDNMAADGYTFNAALTKFLGHLAC